MELPLFFHSRKSSRNRRIPAWQGMERPMATPQVIDDILQRAEALYQQKNFVAASQLLSDAIAEAPSARLWNDWAAVQVSLVQLQDAEGGFRVALKLDPASTQAAENLGAVLFARACHAEAAPRLRQALAGASAQARPVIEQILALCEAEGHRAEPSASVGPVSNAITSATASAVTPAQPARRWD